MWSESSIFANNVGTVSEMYEICIMALFLNLHLKKITTRPCFFLRNVSTLFKVITSKLGRWKEGFPTFSVFILSSPTNF